MNDKVKINNFLEILKRIPVNSEDEQIILNGLMNAEGPKNRILIIGEQTGDPMSLLPVDVPLFAEADAPFFPVDVVYGESFVIRLHNGNSIREFSRAEDFRNAVHEGSERCVIESPAELLRSVDLRFCFLDPDPDREYESSFFAKLTDGCSGCIFVLGAGDGALLNNIREFGTWIAGTGVLTKNAAVILNHAENDSPNPFLTTMLKKLLGADELAGIVATTYSEYVDEEPDIYFTDEALKSAVAAVASKELGSDEDEVIRKCRASVSEKIEQEKQRLLSELDEIKAGIKVSDRIVVGFPPFVKTMLPSSEVILTEEMKQNIYVDLHQFLQKLHNSIPMDIEKCAEQSPDTYKYDLMCFASDYLGDVINSGIKELMSDVVDTLSKSLDKKFDDIRSEFLIHIKEMPEFSAMAGNKDGYLNFVDVKVSNYIPEIVKIIAKLPGFLAGMLTNHYFYGLGPVVKELVNALLNGVVTETVIKLMPQKKYLDSVRNALQTQLLDAMNQLSELLEQYVYPKLSGYIVDARDGMIINYCGSIKLVTEKLVQKSTVLNDRIVELEAGLNSLN